MSDFSPAKNAGPVSPESPVIESPVIESSAATLDDVKNFWNQRPCNIRHSAKKSGTKEYFDEVEARKYFVEPHIPGFADFNRWRGKKVLEIGCGIGTDAINFSRAGADYTGIDLSEESLALTRQRFDAFKLKGRLLSCNAEKIDTYFGCETFDLIYSFGVLHHTPDPAAAFKAIRCLMTPTSELRVMLYARESWKAAMIEAGLDQPEAQYGCPIANTYRLQDLSSLLKGYDIIESRQDHIFPYQIEAYKAYQYIREPWFAAMPDYMFKALEKSLGWHLLVTAKLANAREQS